MRSAGSVYAKNPEGDESRPGKKEERLMKKHTRQMLKSLLTMMLVVIMVLSSAVPAMAAPGRSYGRSNWGRGWWNWWGYGYEEPESAAEEAEEEEAAPEEAVSEEAEEPESAAEESEEAAEEEAVSEEAESEEAAEEAASEESEAEEIPAEEETPAEEEPAEVIFPAQNFKAEDADNDLTVTVEAPEGALPENAGMRIRKVKASDYQAAAMDAVSGEIDVVLAVDISFYDENGAEIEPAVPVQVTMTAPEIAQIAEPIVVHISDETEATVVDQAEIAAPGESGDPVVQTPRITYNFLGEIKEDGTASEHLFYNKAGDQVSFQIVKDGGSLDEIPAPVTSINKAFLGWYKAEKTGDTYSFVQPEERILFGERISVAEDGEVYVAPKYGEAFLISFYEKIEGAADNNILTKKLVPVGEGGTAVVRVDDVKAPSKVTAVQTAWVLDGTEYPLSTNPEITVTKDSSLYPVFSEGHWLRFVGGESGSGASYTSAIFVTENTAESELSKLPVPERAGFTFGGWYKGSMTDGKITYGDRVTNSTGTVTNPSALKATLLSEDLYLYAKWNGQPVSYRVVEWLENADDDDYSFDKATNGTGNAGATTNVTAGTRQGFTAQTITQQVIKGDGSTVVNIYYKRNIYEYKFYDSRNREYSDLKISAKYGADVHDQWPSYKGYDAAWRVTRNGSVFVIQATTMPIGGGNFYAYGSGSTYVQDVFRVQNIDGSNNFTDYNIARYLGSRSTFNTAEDYTAIKGFRLNAASSSDAQQIRSGGGDPEATYDRNYYCSDPIGTTYGRSGHTINNTYSVLFYYLRNQYNVVFEENGGPAVSDLTGIYYEANIASVKASEISALNAAYVKNETKKTVSGEGTYVFQGWYSNEACVGDEFDFNQKMPAGNITLFAKWSPIEYRIEIEPRGGILNAEGEVTYTWVKYGDEIGQYNLVRPYVESESGDYYYRELLYGNDPDAASDQRKAYYVEKSAATAEDLKYIDTSKTYKEATDNDYYTLLGWNNKKNNKTYDFGSPVVEDTAIYAVWRRSGTYEIRYDPIWITTGDEGEIRVSGTISNAVDTGYADKSETPILNTPTNITVSGSEDGYVFKGWQIVDKFIQSSEESQTVLSDTIYKQGDNFVVDSQYANDDHVIFLQAIYEPVKHSSVPLEVTKITFDPNFPAGAAGTSGEAFTVDKLPLNTKIELETYNELEGGNTFSSSNYELIGWNTQADGSGTSFGLDDQVGVDEFDLDDKNTKANTLYAVWETKYFYVFHSATAKLQAVPMEDVEETYDLTNIVTDNNLYGGWYTEYAGADVEKVDAAKIAAKNADDKFASVEDAEIYDGSSLVISSNAKVRFWNKAKIGSVIGNAMTPEADAVYYLKEVPDDYLKVRLQYIYDYRNKEMQKIILMTAMDDNFYKQIDFEVASTVNKAKLTASYSFMQRGSEDDSSKTVKVTADSFDGISRGYLGYYDASALLIKANISFEVLPCWTTLDGVKVEGTAKAFEIGDTIEYTNLKVKE